MIWSFPGLSDAAKRRVSHPEPWRRLRALLLFRARGAYSTTEFRAWIEPRLSSRVRKLAALIIARLPGCVVNLFASLYALMRRFGPLRIDLANSPYDYRRCLRRLLHDGTQKDGKLEEP